jgi:hypothetical protein
MARKKVEKAHWTPDEKLRPLTGWQHDDDKHLIRERVAMTLDDAGLRRLQHEAAAVREKLAEARGKMDALKREMKPNADRERALIEAMVSGTLDEWREVYAYADEEAGVVYQYDPITKELLATRELETYERQRELDYDEEDEDHDAEDEGHA